MQKTTEELMKQLTAENAALREDKRNSDKAKTRIRGGWYMMTKTSEKYIRALVAKNRNAFFLFSLLCEHMDIGKNTCTIKNKDAAAYLNVSDRTVTRVTKILEETNFVKITRQGNEKTYEVNERIAFAGKRQQRDSIFKEPINIEIPSNFENITLSKKTIISPE